MIILEYLLKFVNRLFYYTVRPIVFLITARNCKRCEHYVLYRCALTFDEYVKCIDTVHRCNFKRKYWFR